MAKNLNELFAGIPALRQLLLLAGLALAIAAGIGIYAWSRAPDYVLMFSGVEGKDTMEAAEVLNAAQIPYKLEPGGNGLSVPRAELENARMKLAAEGLPRSGGIGVEMLRESPSLGISPAMESARFQSALETELARTIASLRPVQGARVHLALPKTSAFTRDRRPASASVFLQVYAGRSLDAEQVAAIVNMVASSVPDLDPRHVTVIDQRGRLLTQPEANNELGMSAAQLDYEHQLEENLAQRVEDLLLPMTGPGRVRVKVNADVDFSVVEEASESYTPDAKMLRSEHTSEQTVRGGAPLGVPGAASNQPAGSGGSRAPALASAAQDATTQSSDATRNYELDKTISHTRMPSGRIQRLSVAVLVDHIPQQDAKGKTTLRALNPDELKKLQALVQEAVGADSDRGDTINVMNMPFQRSAEDLATPDLPLWQRPLVLEVARSLAGILLLIGLVVLVVRPALRNLLQAPLKPAAAALPDGRVLAEDVALIGSSGGNPGAAPALSSPARGNAYEDKLNLARAAVGQDPKRVAQVVKTWVNSDA